MFSSTHAKTSSKIFVQFQTKVCVVTKVRSLCMVDSNIITLAYTRRYNNSHCSCIFSFSEFFFGWPLSGVACALELGTRGGRTPEPELPEAQYVAMPLPVKSKLHLFRFIVALLLTCCRRRFVVQHLDMSICCGPVVDLQLVTFCVNRRRREMYCGHARLCVCLSVCSRPHARTIARTRM